LLTSSHADMMLFVSGRGPQLKTPILLTWKHTVSLADCSVQTRQKQTFS